MGSRTKNTACNLQMVRPSRACLPLGPRQRSDHAFE
jgi:hypothetical protein